MVSISVNIKLRWLAGCLAATELSMHMCVCMYMSCVLCKPSIRALVV